MTISLTKNLFSILFFTATFFLMISCGNSNNEKTTTSAVENAVTTLKYDGEDQEFDLKYTYANFNSMYKSYRVLFLTYPKDQDSDDWKKLAGQKRLVIGLFNPLDGEFRPGKYTLTGDENGFNKASVQVETESGLKMCNINGIENSGFIEVLSVSGTEITGKFDLTGTDFHAVGEFNTKHE